LSSSKAYLQQEGGGEKKRKGEREEMKGQKKNY